MNDRINVLTQLRGDLGTIRLTGRGSRLEKRLMTGISARESTTPR
jgi:hypothetical protein